MTPVHLTAPLVTPSTALDHERAGRDWCVRLTFVGPNPANASGESRKYWLVLGRGLGTAEVRWGRIGAAGQSQIVSVDDALDRAREKLRKGYALDDGTGLASGAVAARRLGSARPLSFAERLARASVSTVALGGLLDLAALRGWLPLDGCGIDPEAALRSLGYVVSDAHLYVDRDSRCWLAGCRPTSEYVVAQLPPAEVSA